MPPANAIDWPNSGELRLPPGGPRLTRLKIFRPETPSVRLYRWPLSPPPPKPPIPPPPPPPPRPPPPPPDDPPPTGPPNVPGGRLPLPFPALVSAFLPKPMVLLRRRFTVNCDGPVPRFGGTIVAVAAGAISKLPNFVTTRFCGSVAEVAKDGRSLKIESPLRSWPMVKLNGMPELAIMNGLARNP